MAWAYALVGDFSASVEASIKSIQLEPTLCFSQLNLGMAYLALSDTNLAESAYQDAIDCMISKSPIERAFLLEVALVDLQDLAETEPGVRDVDEWADRFYDMWTDRVFPFEDDFSDPSVGLRTDFSSGLTTSYYRSSSENYYMELKATHWQTATYRDGFLPNSFRIEVSAAYQNASVGYGIVFQVVDEGYYAFIIDERGHYSVWKYDSSTDAFSTLINWAESDSIFTVEMSKNLLAVSGHDGVYELYINGSYVDSFEDSDYSGGKFGFFAQNYDEEQVAYFYFDNLTVEKID